MCRYLVIIIALFLSCDVDARAESFTISKRDKAKIIKIDPKFNYAEYALSPSESLFGQIIERAKRIIFRTVSEQQIERKIFALQKKLTRKTDRLNKLQTLVGAQTIQKKLSKDIHFINTELAILHRGRKNRKTPTPTSTMTATFTAVNTASNSVTSTPTRTATATSLASPSRTATRTATPTATKTSGANPTFTSTATRTPTRTSTPTANSSSPSSIPTIPTPQPVVCDLYVSQNNANCSDTDPTAGTQTKPFCSISRANEKHISGHTVCINSGKYRESILPKAGNSQQDPTVYAGTGPLGSVIISGSDKVTGWTPYGNSGAWVADLLIVPQERCENYDQDTGHSCAHPTTPEHHCMVNSTDCWQSGTRWFTRADKDPQVSARFLANANPSLVDAEGEYFFDRSTGKVYIKPFGGINPNNVDIECSVRAVAPLMHEFAQYWPAGYSPGDNMTIQNLHFEHSNRNALTLNNFDNIKILGNDFSNNSGGESCRSNPAAIIVHKSSCGGAYPLPCSCYNTGLEIRDNIVSHQGSDVGPGRGQCIETYHTNNSIIDGNILSDCGTGIYTKSGHCGGFVSNNFVSQYDNAFQIQSNVFGISIMNNIATDPRSGARFMYYTGSSQGNRVCNNTVLGSDLPSDGLAARFDNGLAVVKGNYFGNNLREPLIQSDGGTFPDSNHNFFQGSTVARGYPSLSSWQSASGNDMNSEQVPYSKSAPPIAAGNGVISAGSPLIDQGVKIDGYHCNLAGVQDFPGCRVWYGAAPDAGAYEYKP